MSIIMKMIYVCKSDPSIRFYDDVSLKAFVESNNLDKRYSFWETIYEVFDDTTGSEIHTDLNLAYTPRDILTSSQRSIDRSTSSSSTTNFESYIRYIGTIDGNETIPNAVGSGRTITYKNSSNFKWTLNAANANTIDGTPFFTLQKKCSISIVDSALNTWDII